MRMRPSASRPKSLTLPTTPTIWCGVALSYLMRLPTASSPGQKRRARAEVRVEAAVGQPGRVHQIGHADAVEALFAQLDARPAHNASVSRSLVFGRVTSHVVYCMTGII